MPRPLAIALASLALALLAAAPAAAEPQRPLVYVFVLDALDGDALDDGELPFLSALLRGERGASGAYYPRSRSVMVSETNPNHVAMATGAYPNTSGITGNAFAVYAPIEDDESCPAPGADPTVRPHVTSGESAGCLEAETLFTSLARVDHPERVTTAGIFGKPKLARIFSTRRAAGPGYDADHLWTPCGLGSDAPDYCENVPFVPSYDYSLFDIAVMDEVIETTREGVREGARLRRPDLTFVNFPQIDNAGHAFGRGVAYDESVAIANGQIERFVANQKQLGIWGRTVMLVVSDHSMETTLPTTKTPLSDLFDEAGIPGWRYEIVGNGGAAHVYLTNRSAPGRFDLLRRLRRAALGGPGLWPVQEALYREPNLEDGGSAHTLAEVHPEWGLGGPRAGDLVVTHARGGAFLESSDASSVPFNPLTGNHGSTHTADNTFAIVSGGPFVRPGRYLERAVTVDVAPTVARLLGYPPPADSEGTFRAEAFRLDLLP